eukprot:UN08086
MVHYIGFHVSDGTLKECYWPQYNMSSSTDTGWIIHSSHFLSGFFVRIGGVIDLIAFQFSNLLLLPTNEPTNYPTIDPTTDPTLDPTIYPTTYPTSDPTIYRT